ncbi:MAG: isoamylase early set domain-containing protein [Spirochaetes bacterium]|nr:isoamylase early set domain-containing protein [Spirochaetota bacterium]
MKQSNIDDNYVRRKLRSLRRVSAPERAVKSLYQRIARQKAAYNEQGQTGLISGILSMFQYKKALLVTILATLLIAVPATFFLTKKYTAAANTQKTYIVKFIFEDKDADTVTLLGDFNNWKKGEVNMQKIQNTDFWTAEITLSEGIYKYAFLIDDNRWSKDPMAQINVKDDFGKESSLIVLVDTPEQKVKL